MAFLSQDLRYALRGMRRQPAFTALAVVALALGIGASTTIFSVIENVLLDPFPYVNADRVVQVQIRDLRNPRPGGRTFFQTPELLDYQSRIQVFEDVIAGTGEDVLYDSGAGTEQYNGALVSANMFQFLGVPPMAGRGLGPADAQPGAPAVFVMSHKMWMKKFFGDTSIVGRSFVLNGVPATLVGIMPARFTKLGADVYRVVTLDRANPEMKERYFMLQARLRPGVTLEQAEAEISVVARDLARTYPRNYPERFGVKVVSWVDNIVGPFRKTLYTLAAAVGLLLLIACSNVANMLLARSTTRTKEMAVRASVGATRGRLVQQLLIESFLLAAMGAVLGSVLAFFGLKLLVAAIPEGTIPQEAVIRLNLPVLAFSLVLAAVTSVVFGLVPALQSSRPDLMEPLRAASKGSATGSHKGRLTGGLVVAEVALSLMLLAGAGLLIRSFMNLQSVDLGLDPRNVLHARLPLPRGQYRTAGEKQVLFRQMLSRVQALPGVVSATVVSSLPPYGGIRSELDIAGKPHTEKWEGIFQLVSEGHARTLGLRLLSGRLLSEADVNDTRKVAVINRTLADRYFGQENPLGRRLTIKMLTTLPAEVRVDDPTFEIIGVVSDSRNQGLRDAIMPEAYVPHAITGAFERGVLVRTANAPSATVNAFRASIWAVDRNIALTMIGTLTESLKQYSYAEPRFGLVVLAVFAVVGLLLVALGVYSVIAYMVSRQLHDIGIRMALGATPGAVLAGVLRRGMRLVAVGVVMGIAASLVVTRVLADQLFGVKPHDLPTLLGAVGVLVAAAVFACWFPARRATRVDPMVALRSS